MIKEPTLGRKVKSSLCVVEFPWPIPSFYFFVKRLENVGL